MQRLLVLATALLLAACSSMPSWVPGSGWTTLIDGDNGQKTVDIQDAKFAPGPFALQFGNHGKLPGAPIKWRKVEVRSL